MYIIASRAYPIEWNSRYQYCTDPAKTSSPVAFYHFDSVFFFFSSSTFCASRIKSIFFPFSRRESVSTQPAWPVYGLSRIYYEITESTNDRNTCWYCTYVYYSLCAVHIRKYFFGEIRYESEFSPLQSRNKCVHEYKNTTKFSFAFDYTCLCVCARKLYVWVDFAVYFPCIFCGKRKKKKTLRSKLIRTMFRFRFQIAKRRYWNEENSLKRILFFGSLKIYSNLRHYIFM